MAILRAILYIDFLELMFRIGYDTDNGCLPRREEPARMFDLLGLESLAANRVLVAY
jgi:hypothetical protein